MLRKLLTLLILVCTAGALFAARMQGYLGNTSEWIEKVWLEKSTPVPGSTVEYEALNQVNVARSAAGTAPLVNDTPFHDFLVRELGKAPAKTLDEILSAWQKANPCFVRVAALSIRSFTPAGVQKELQNWKESSDKDYTHVAVVAQPGMGNMWQGCVVIVGERLPDFSPELLNAGTVRSFYSVCSLCGHGHPCSVQNHNQTFSLECPHCHRIYTILAADSQKKMHYVNEYLTEYAPPAHFPKALSREQEMLLIWRAVGKICKYTLDPADPNNTTSNDPTDAWQFALETQVLGTGDCEDSSILLADWLHSRGFEARVAIGRFAERGGHAWVVTRLDGKEYLLESTAPNPRLDSEPLAIDVGSRYVPDAMFDYDSIYVRTDPHDIWDGKYWDQSKWVRSKQRVRRAPSKSPVALELSTILQAKLATMTAHH
jgi:hypothetical protein